MATEKNQGLPHVGRLIEIRLDEMGMTKAEFARRIGTTRQSVNSMLDKSSIDTAYLYRIGKALNHNFFRDLATEEEKKPDRLPGEILLASAQAQASITHLSLLLLRDY